MSETSELRKDIVCGDWVVIATGRAKRPHDFLNKKREPFFQPQSECPFESQFPEPLAIYKKEGDDWWVQVVANKFPAFGKGECDLVHKIGLYSWKDGVGAHEVVITKDHEKPLALMSDSEAELVIQAYQERYLALSQNKCVNYISIFHNSGPEAGATIYHPHSQIIAIPVIPPDVGRSLRGSKEYFNDNKRCAHCAVLEFETEVGQRIIYENNSFVVIAPYASKSAFECRIFPRRHGPYFEEIPPQERADLAQALRILLAKIYKGLENPDFNFFIHTAPVREKNQFEHYHWHMEIMPKTGIWAGFEIGTGIEISTIAPEEASKFLKEIPV